MQSGAISGQPEMAVKTDAAVIAENSIGSCQLLFRHQN